MILIVLSALLLLFFVLRTKDYPYYLVTYFVFYDMFDGFYREEKIFALLRYFLPLLLLVIYLVKFKVPRRFSLSFSILIAYLLVLWAINPGEPAITTRTVLSVLLTLLMLPMGMHLAAQENMIARFEPFNRLLLIAVPLYVLYANAAGIEGYYSDAFSTGYLVTSRIYIIPLVILLSVHYLSTGTRKSWLLILNDALFIVANLCVLLVNTRRTSLAMILLALLVYVWFNRHLLIRMLLLLAALAAALVVSFPLYEAPLTAQLEKRSRIQDVSTYEDEGRYLETLYILDYHKKSRDFASVLVGVKLFDTQRIGTIYFGRDRPLHSDINMIFYSTGVIGLILFFVFFFHHFWWRNRRIQPANRQLFYPLLLMFCIILVPGRFIGTLTYAPLLMLLLSFLKNRQTAEQGVTAPGAASSGRPAKARTR